MLMGFSPGASPAKWLLMASGASPADTTARGTGAGCAWVQSTAAVLRSRAVNVKIEECRLTAFMASLHLLQSAQTPPSRGLDLRPNGKGCLNRSLKTVLNYITGSAVLA